MSVNRTVCTPRLICFSRECPSGLRDVQNIFRTTKGKEIEEKRRRRESSTKESLRSERYFIRERSLSKATCGEVKQRRHSTAEDTLEYSSGEIYEISAFEEFESRITIAHGTYARIYIHTYIYMPMSNEPAKKYRILLSMIIRADCDTLFTGTAFKKFITLRWPLR